MTAMTVETGTPALPSRGPRGLLRTVLRLHRAALLVGGLVLAATTAYLVWLYSIGDEARPGISACAVPATDGLPSCDAVRAITTDETYSSGISLIATVLSYLLLPVAAWAGGALVGRELESGTAQLAWTQSVSPVRWLAVKLAAAAVPLAAGAGALVLLNLWARRDGNPDLVGDWYHPDVFVSTGPTAVAYPLAGLGLGALAGLVCRRALPAVGIGVAATLVLHNVLERYREDFWPAVTRSENRAFELPRSAWQLGSNRSWDAETGTSTPITDATFHPRSHFWPLQYVETGIVLAVAAAATAAAFWLLRRRTP